MEGREVAAAGDDGRDLNGEGLEVWTDLFEKGSKLRFLEVKAN